MPADFKFRADIMVLFYLASSSRGLCLVSLYPKDWGELLERCPHKSVFLDVLSLDASNRLL